MTRRDLLLTLGGLTALEQQVKAEGFIFSGRLTSAGMPGEGYYAIGQLVSFNLHPDAKAMTAGADALLDRDVEIRLTAK